MISRIVDLTSGTKVNLLQLSFARPELCYHVIPNYRPSRACRLWEDHSSSSNARRGAGAAGPDLAQERKLCVLRPETVVAECYYPL